MANRFAVKLIPTVRDCGLTTPRLSRWTKTLVLSDEEAEALCDKIADTDDGIIIFAAMLAAAKHWVRAKDATKLREAVAAKIDAQADYVVWRDSVVMHGGDRKSKSRSQTSDLDLPDADPGDKTAHRWRKSFCIKTDTGTRRDADKIASAKIDRQARRVDSDDRARAAV
jgi:hypothetical protein